MGLIVTGAGQAKAVSCSCENREFTLSMVDLKGTPTMFAVCTGCHRVTSVAEYTVSE